jgi:hypothetical protein
MHNKVKDKKIKQSVNYVTLIVNYEAVSKTKA